MKNLWSDKEAAKYSSSLARRVYTSRLLGQDSSLVLHGGGNTSVKITEKNLLTKMKKFFMLKGVGGILSL
jgi:rhamnose utilization protein RhaD (predicted bifunctional aldolase and dehydrogenase)